MFKQIGDPIKKIFFFLYFIVRNHYKKKKNMFSAFSLNLGIEKLAQ